MMPRANRAFISPPNSMASVISETKNSSKQSTSVSAFKAVGDDLQRVAMSLQGGQLFVYAQHETMEMQALFTLARQALVKQVHQPGFASPHAAPHIQAADRCRPGSRLALTQQFAEFRAQTAA